MDLREPHGDGRQNMQDFWMAESIVRHKYGFPELSKTTVVQLSKTT